MVQMKLFAGQEQRHRCREQACGHSGGREGEMNWEIGIDIHRLLCIKQIASGKLLHSRELGSVLCDDLEGWDRGGGVGGRPKKEGIYVHIKMIHVDVQQKQGLPGWLSGKESASDAKDTEDTGSIPGSGRSPGGGHDNPLQYSCLENPTDRGAWRATFHRVAKSDTTEHACTHSRK